MDNVRGLKAFGPLDYFKLHRRALLEIAVAVSLDCRKVDKDVFTRSPLDESVALTGVEPFYGALFSIAIHVYIYSLV